MPYASGRVIHDADAHIIASGIQFLPQEHRFEKWANFPAARQRFLSLLAETTPKGVLLISGDRHIGEMAKITVPSVSYPVYEITSSGLTPSATNNTGEANKWSTGILKNPCNCGACKSTINARSAPAVVSRSATSFEEMGTRGLSFRSCRA